MKLRSIPDPIITSFRRKPPELKPLVQVTLPRPQAGTDPASSKPGVKRAERPPEPKITATAESPKTGPEEKPKYEGIPVAKQQAHIPALEVEDGTAIPQPFKSVDDLTALSSPHPTLAMVMLRQLRDMAGPMPDTSNGALSVLDRLETRLKSGEDIGTLTDEIAAYIMGDDEHNEVFIRLHDAHDRERLTEMDKSRAKWEDFCHACMRRSDLNIIEGMAVMSYFNSQQSTILSRLERKKNKGENNLSRESADLVNRINRPTLIQDKMLQRKFDEASPQEREILRKLGFKLENALAARITTTTKTVEVIQPKGEDIDV